MIFYEKVLNITTYQNNATLKPFQNIVSIHTFFLDAGQMIEAERKAVSDFYWLKTPPVPSVASQVRGNSFERFPRPNSSSIHPFSSIHPCSTIHPVQR